METIPIDPQQGPALFVHPPWHTRGPYGGREGQKSMGEGAQAHP